MNRTLMSGVGITLASIGIFSCSEHNLTGVNSFSSESPSADPSQTVTVSVSLGSDSIAVGDTTSAIVTAKEYGGQILNRYVTWTSSDPGVASVDTTGLIRALAVGTAVITASRGFNSGSAVVTVTPAIQTNPGTVTDLRVIGIDSTGVTLSFTQVDDGTGQPAKYDVRYATAPIPWSSAPSASSGSCAVPVAGTAIGSSLVCKVLGLAPASHYYFQLIAFRGTPELDAVFGALSNYVSATTTATTTITPPPPPPPPTGSFNEPAGMTFIDQRAFNSLTENAAPHSPAWDTDNTLSIVQDPTAPISPPNVIRATYNAGFTAGTAPGHAGFAHRPYHVLYIRFAFKLSANWVGNGSGTNKLMYEWTQNPNNPAFFFSAHGVGSGPLLAQVNLQGVAIFPGGIGNLVPNLVPGAQIIRGRWHVLEAVLTGNSAGTADGKVDWWLDGVHIGSYGNFQWSSVATTFGTFEFRPIWGGVNTSPAITQAQTMDWDNVYISGKN